MQVSLNKEEADFIIQYLDTHDFCEPKNERMAGKLCKRIERAMTPIKSRSAKNKGLEWQKEVCRFISNLIGVEYDQKSDDCLIHSRESGLSGTDVILRGEAKEKFPYSVECKNCKTLSIPEWIRQADSNADNGNWILFIKSPVIDTKKVVILSLESFEAIYKKTQK